MHRGEAGPVVQKLHNPQLPGSQVSQVILDRPARGTHFEQLIFVQGTQSSFQICTGMLDTLQQFSFIGQIIILLIGHFYLL